MIRILMTLLVPGILLCATTVAQTMSFTEKTMIATGGRPHAVTTADFDGDGDNDIAVITLAPDYLQVFRNDNGESLQLIGTYPCSSGPYDIDTTDCDHDGAVDIVVVCAATSKLRVFKNDGTGGFSEYYTQDVITYPIRIETADLDGDGNTEMLVTYQLLNKIDIFSTNALGQIVSLNTINSGIHTYETLCVDFDSDGDPDIAATIAGEDVVRVFLNDGSGNFIAGPEQSVGTFPWSIVAGDFDGDTWPDLVIGNYFPSDFRVLFNNGGTGFTGIVGPFAVGYETTWLNVADLDLDNDEDILVSHGGRYSGGGMIIYSNDGTGTFNQDLSLGSDRNHSALADFDGQGGLDIIVNGFFTSTLAIYTNDATCEGTISGLVTDGLNGLSSISIDLIDTEGDIQSTAMTGALGEYEFVGLAGGDYGISIATPLGYMADSETKDITIQCETATVDFLLSTLEIIPNQRSRGYWKHQVSHVIKNMEEGKDKPTDYSAQDFIDFLSLIENHFVQNRINPIPIYDGSAALARLDSLKLLKTILSAKNHEDDDTSKKLRKGKAELMSLILNVVSAKISQTEIISADGANVSQAITYTWMLLNDAITCTDEEDDDDDDAEEDECHCNYKKAEKILKKINHGKTVKAGIIPLDIQFIAYKNGLVPVSYSLNQNYPNPFNPATKIDFSLPKASQVTLEVYNITGQKVITVIDQYLAAGFYTVDWDSKSSDGKPLASGIYFYRLKAEDFLETKKMLLLK